MSILMIPFWLSAGFDRRRPASAWCPATVEECLCPSPGSPFLGSIQV